MQHFTISIQKLFRSAVILLLSIHSINTLGQPTAEQICELTPYAAGDHAVWLNSLPGDPSTDYIFDVNGGTMTIYSDSTAEITGRIQNINDTTRQWDMILSLENFRDHNTWINIGRLLKNGGGASPADQLNWVFYELDSTKSFFYAVPGTHFDGDTLQVYHRPTNYLYGFQLGVGANDKNGNYGMSGWFGFDGSYQGKGDINVNMVCDTVTVPPPVCDVAIDTFYAQCKTDSSFEMVISFSGSGTNYQISDDQGTPVVDSLAAGTYTFGDYFNSTDVVLIVSDPNFTSCADTTLPATADCTPVPVCDLMVDTVYTQCLTDTTFTVLVTFSGSSNQYSISDDQGTPHFVNLVAGSYIFGTYHQDTAVQIVISDSALFSCIRVLGPLSDSCSMDSSGGNMVAGLRADPVEGEVHLSWFTTQEYENMGFEVQRSEDGEIWETIGWKEGMFTLEETTRYRFIDNNIGDESSCLYRLRQMGMNGDFRFSKALRVNMENLEPMSVGMIYPNPLAGRTNVSIVAEANDLQYTVTVVDGMGRTRYESAHALYQGRQDVSFDLSHLQPGLYFMQFAIDGRPISTQRILVTEGR